MKNLQALDKKYIWHPFTQMADWEKEEILIIEKGKGSYLFDTQGRRYLDGVSSLWCNVHGHQVKELDRAVQRQLKKIAHSTFLGLSNIPAIELAEKLIAIAPRGLRRVFYSDSGSEAVEIALKMAYQYWRQKGKNKKIRFARLAEAYHGDTLGSVSVGGIGLFHEIYRPLLFKTFGIPSPFLLRRRHGLRGKDWLRESLQAVEAVLKKHSSELAALILEPKIQGAAGMHDQPEGYLAGVRKLTFRYNVLLIFDEVATGFGRTGKMFAADHEKVTPDLMAVAKGLTGGYLPLAATLASEEIYEGFLGDGSKFKTFFHGHTYTANPLACSAALANLELFRKKKIIQMLPEKINRFRKGLSRIASLPHVGEVRQAGMMAGIELVRERNRMKPYLHAEKIGIRTIQEARRRGAILRPLGNVIVLMPPLGISNPELEQLLDITYQSIKKVTENRN